MYTRNEHHRFPLSIRDKAERKGCLQRFEGAAGVAGGGWRRLRMRDGRSKTATDNKSYDDTFYRSIGERRRLRPAWKGRSWRESSSFLERDHLCCLGERLPRSREEAIYHSWNPLSTSPPIPLPPSWFNHTRPFHASTRASEHHPPSLSSSFSSFSIQTRRRSLPAC